MARSVNVNALYGGHVAAPDVALKGMAELEQELSKRHNERESKRAASGQQFELVFRPLLDLVGKDQRASQGLQGLSNLQQTARLPLTSPVARKASSRIFLPAGATIAPPYDYQWTWDAVSGSLFREGVTADSASGQMHFVIDTNHDNSSAASTAAAVGSYFSPLVAQGMLHIYTTPNYSSAWALWCAFYEGQADGWIGLYVGEYDLNGNFVGAPVNFSFSLWTEDLFFGDPSGGGVDSLSLQATCPVDSDHFYVIWTWCGGTASGAGFNHFLSAGSAAYSEMYVNVPSITWELS
jgi:hypothetical protein